MAAIRAMIHVSEMLNVGNGIVMIANTFALM